MRKYFCDRCGIETWSLFIGGCYGYAEVCFNCKVDLDVLHLWCVRNKLANIGVNYARMFSNACFGEA